MEEVADMESYTMTRNTGKAVLPLTPARTLIPAAPSVRPVAVPAAELPVSRVHQVRAQAELAQVLLLDGINGTNGTTGFGITVAKRYTDGSSGVPPRGRPV